MAFDIRCIPSIELIYIWKMEAFWKQNFWSFWPKKMS